MKRKSLWAVLMVLATMMLLTACGSKTILTGTYADDAGNTYTFDKVETLTIKGKGNENGMPAKYYVTPNEDDELAGKVEIIIPAVDGKELTKNATYKLEDKKKKLTITGEDGSTSVLAKQ